MDKSKISRIKMKSLCILGRWYCTRSLYLPYLALFGLRISYLEGFQTLHFWLSFFKYFFNNWRFKCANQGFLLFNRKYFLLHFQSSVFNFNVHFLFLHPLPHRFYIVYHNYYNNYSQRILYRFQEEFLHQCVQFLSIKLVSLQAYLLSLLILNLLLQIRE